jgi:hypothetical protein
MVLHQMTSHGSPRPVELGRAVAGFPKQDDPAIGESIEQLPEAGVIEIRQVFCCGREQFRHAAPL